MMELERRSLADFDAETSATAEETGAPIPVKARMIALERRMSVQQAVAAIASACFSHIEANEAAVRYGADPEGVHQLRVAVRRLRSAISLLRRCLPEQMCDSLGRELQWLAGEFGGARDWDVFQQNWLRPLAADAAADPGLRQIEERVAAFRAEAYRNAVAALDTERFLALMDRLRSGLEAGFALAVKRKQRLLLRMPIAELAGEVLPRRHKRLRKHGGRHRRLELEELHALRIKAKKMRYAVEFFRQLYPTEACEKYLTALVGLQDVLGGINDAAVAHERLVQVLAAEPERQSDRPALERAGHLLTGQFDGQIEEQRQAFVTAWRKFRRCQAFWD